MKRIIGLCFLIFCCVFLMNNSVADTATTHFGFSYYAAYEDCLKTAQSKYSGIVEFAEPDIGSLVPIPGFGFTADFFGNPSFANILAFTPKSKKLYRIMHDLRLSSDDEFAKASLAMLVALKEKYGAPDPSANLDLIKSPRARALAKAMRDQTSEFTWTRGNLQIIYNAINKSYGNSDENAVMITYVNVAAEKLKDREQKELQRTMHGDL